MDRSYSSVRQDHRHSTTARHRRENPSFSSTLLDAIYRSIDAGDIPHDDDYADRSSSSDIVFYRETAMRKNSAVATSAGAPTDDEKMANFRRACMIEKWMEKKVTEKVVLRRSSAADFDSKVSHSRRLGAPMNNSSSSSSDSSSGGGFSSSESESLRRSRPKPIRTSLSAPPSEASQFGGSAHSRHHHQSAPKAKSGAKHESLNSFVKTKSKALKIYGDLKRVKQPISPGGRLASFLNSLFTNAASPRKSGKAKPATAATATTPCSSASSFSRSCLSSASSTNKFSDAAKRSVRFCPVSVIVGEDCRPCGQKSVFDDDLKISGDRRRVQEVAIDLLKGYQKNSVNDAVGAVVEDFDMRDVDVVRMRNDANVYENDNEVDDEDDDDDDAASYSSSDLFELDNLSAIGIERYREELPVYETTHFDTNRAIASGLIL